MKIAIFAGKIQHGAFFNVITALVCSLTKNNIDEIDLLCLNGTDLDLKNYCPKNVHVVVLSAKRALTSTVPLVSYLYRMKPDVFITMPSYINIVSLLPKFLGIFNYVHIITEHATMSAESVEHKGEFVMGNMPFFARYFYRFADVLIGVSNGVIDDLRNNIGITKPRMYKIVNPVNIEAVISKANKPKMNTHPWLFEGQRIPCFVSVGRLAKQKNFSLLLKALSFVNKKTMARLLIIGDGDQKKYLKELITKYDLGGLVDLIGFKNNPYPFIKYSDGFLLSSKEEAFGLVLVEAMALGVPIIATDAIGGGPIEVLEHGKYGVIVDRDSPELFGKAIIELIENRKKFLPMIEISKKRAFYYSCEKVGFKWKKLLDDLINN